MSKRTPAFPPWSVGDRSPPLALQILQSDGITPLDLTGKAVAFEMQLVNRTGSVIGSAGAASIVGDPTLGNVQYAWGASDLATAGNYDGEFLITSGGITQVYPAESLRIVVRPRV